MKKVILMCMAVAMTGAAMAQLQGVSSSKAAFMLPKLAGVQTKSIITVGDSVGGYKMVGIPDGMGALKNSNGLIETFMNHELGTTQGIVRAHGSAGSFVSKWVIDPTTHQVMSGSDLITSVAGVPGGAAPFARFCSSDLAAKSAFYNAATGNGTQERIYLTGEETGAEGRAFGTLVTGANSGTAHYLPSLGKFSWENAVAHYGTGDKTIVAGTDDSTPGEMYFYEGTKSATGNDMMKAGLVGGRTLGLKLNGVLSETSSSGIAPTAFSFADLGDAATMSGADLQAASTAAGVTKFARPEDIHWDPTNRNVAYVATTGSAASGSKLWKMTFNNVDDLMSGGTMEAVLDTSDGIASLDNLTVDKNGNVVIQEDAGNNSRLAKIWRYTGSNGALDLVAEADPTLFLNGASGFLTQDEETSGIIDASDLLGEGWYLMSMQVHKPLGGELVEDGQMLAMYMPVPEPASMTVLGLGLVAMMRKRKKN